MSSYIAPCRKPNDGVWSGAMSLRTSTRHRVGAWTAPIGHSPQSRSLSFSPLSAAQIRGSLAHPPGHRRLFRRGRRVALVSAHARSIRSTDRHLAALLSRLQSYGLKFRDRHQKTRDSNFRIGGLGGSRSEGAEAGTRTLTGVLPLRPERSASANSATSAI